MEYTLKFTVSPTEKQDTFHARVFISGNEENRSAGTALIWEQDLWAMHAHRDADAQLWALYVLRLVVNHLDTYVYGPRDRATVKLMADLLEHQEDLGCRS